VERAEFELPCGLPAAVRAGGRLAAASYVQQLSLGERLLSVADSPGTVAFGIFDDRQVLAR
jgi:hypothetical protein